MTETELIEALVAELKEYGEVFIPDEDLVEYPGATWQELQRSLVYEMGGEPLFMTYDMQKCGFLINRVSPPKKPQQREGAHWTDAIFDETHQWSAFRDATRRVQDEYRWNRKSK